MLSMTKRNPKTKRVHGDDNKFVPESEVNERTPFGYDDDDSSPVGVILAAVLLVTAGLWYFGYLPF